MVEGSDFAVVTIGDDDQNIEVLVNAAGMRKLAEAGVDAVTEMDALAEHEMAVGE